MALMIMTSFILLVIFILSHYVNSSANPNSDYERGSLNLNFDFGQGSNFIPNKENVRNGQKTDNDQSLCVRLIRAVFQGPTYREHIRQGMNEFTINDPMNEQAKVYYRSLKNYLSKGQVKTPYKFCKNEPGRVECKSILNELFGGQAISSVHTVFWFYRINHDFENRHANSYFTHLLNRYEILNERVYGSTSPEKCCQNILTC